MFTNSIGEMMKNYENFITYVCWYWMYWMWSLLWENSWVVWKINWESFTGSLGGFFGDFKVRNGTNLSCCKFWSIENALSCLLYYRESFYKCSIPNSLEFEPTTSRLKSQVFSINQKIKSLKLSSNFPQRTTSTPKIHKQYHSTLKKK